MRIISKTKSANTHLYAQVSLIILIIILSIPVSLAAPRFKNYINSCHNFNHPNGHPGLPPILGYTLGEVIGPCVSQCNSYDRFECNYLNSSLVDFVIGTYYDYAHYNALVELTDTTMNTVSTGNFMSADYFQCSAGFIQKWAFDPTVPQFIKCEAVSFSISPNIPPKDCTKEGNPCHPATGNKSQTETDIASAKPFGISFKRFYSSFGDHNSANNFAPGWRHSYERSLNEGIRAIPLDMSPQADQSSLYDTPEEACLNGWQELSGTVYKGTLSTAIATLLSDQDCRIERNGETVAIFSIRPHIDDLHATLPVPKATDNLITLSRQNGISHHFENKNSTWLDPFSAGVSLTEDNGEWLFIDKDGTQERYDSIGNLTRITDRYGHTQTLTYDVDNLLSRVETSTGDFIQFTYDVEQRLSSISDQSGHIWHYRYDAKSNLEFVDNPDNTTRQYHYEDTRFPHHLTGITDENGNRYATWAYDDKGRAISSEHAGGTEKVQFSYNADGTTTVTDAIGAVRTYHFDLVQGGLKVTHIEGDRCATCPNGNIQAYSYDANGNISSKTDWNGVTTTYTYDMNRNLELTRTEASGTPQARTITTEWHPQFRLPTKITEPNKITEYTYDAQGRQLSSKVSSVQ